MPTVTQAFDNFMRGLELTEPEKKEASRQHNDLRARIREHLGGVLHDIIVGSYARRTAIRPLNDIDLFLVLDSKVFTNHRTQAPEHTLDRVRQALQRCYPAPSPSVRIQGRSVNIEFAGTGIGYDVIPAFPQTPFTPQLLEDVVYEIPDRERKAWIKTNPARHKQRCVAANDQAGGMLNRLIKAAKHWNRAQRGSDGRKLLRSFHLEVMAYEAFAAKPVDERRGLRDLFTFLQERVTRKCPDPAGLGPHIDAGMGPEERQQIQAKLREAARLAGEAVRHEERGDHAGACRHWKVLLGGPFWD